MPLPQPIHAEKASELHPVAAHHPVEVEKLVETVCPHQSCALTYCKETSLPCRSTSLYGLPAGRANHGAGLGDLSCSRQTKLLGSFYQPGNHSRRNQRDETHRAIGDIQRVTTEALSSVYRFKRALGGDRSQGIRQCQA